MSWAGWSRSRMTAWKGAFHMQLFSGCPETLPFVLQCVLGAGRAVWRWRPVNIKAFSLFMFSYLEPCFVFLCAADSWFWGASSTVAYLRGPGMFLKTHMKSHDIWLLNPTLAYLTLVHLSVKAELLKLSQRWKYPQSLFHCHWSDLLYQLEE